MKRLLIIGLLIALLVIPLGNTVYASDTDLIICQYYEGSSFNKWIEIYNPTDSAIDISDYYVGLWSNANTEAYKSDGTPSTENELWTVLGTTSIAAKSSVLLRHSSAVLPSYASGSAASSVNFNGDDSYTIYRGTPFATANLVDAIGFTDAGAEGTNNSFVRLITDNGFDTVLGSNVTDFPAVWQEVTNTEVDNASAGYAVRLGECVEYPNAINLNSLSASSANNNVFLALVAVALVAGGGALWLRRRKVA